MSSHVPQEGTRAPLTAVLGRNRLQNAIQNFCGRFWSSKLTNTETQFLGVPGQVAAASLRAPYASRCTAYPHARRWARSDRATPDFVSTDLSPKLPGYTVKSLFATPSPGRRSVARSTPGVLLAPPPVYCPALLGPCNGLSVHRHERSLTHCKPQNVTYHGLAEPSTSPQALQRH